MPQEKQLKSTTFRLRVERNHLGRGLVLEEGFQVFWADPVDPAELHRSKLFIFYKFKYRQMMELQDLCHFFWGQKSLHHLEWFT